MCIGQSVVSTAITIGELLMVGRKGQGRKEWGEKDKWGEKDRHIIGYKGNEARMVFDEGWVRWFAEATDAVGKPARDSQLS